MSTDMQAQAKALAAKANEGIRVKAGTPRGGWAYRKGDKGRVWDLAAMDQAGMVPGTAVVLVNTHGHLTPGSIGEAIRVASDGRTVYSFNRDREAITPALKQARKAHRLLADALYAVSDKGLASAARIAERQAAKAQATAQAPAVPAVATEQATEQAQTVPHDAEGLAALATALRAAGFTPTEVLKALSDHQAQAPAVPAVATAQAPAVKAHKAPAAQGKQARKACPACGKQHNADKFTAHATCVGNPAVCPACITAEGPTIALRITRRAAALKGK